MKKNTFQIETSNFYGASIIPRFIVEDHNLDKETQFHLFEYLKKHQSTNGIIKLRLFKCSCCNHDERYIEMFNHLEKMNYLNVVSKEKKSDRMEYKIKINKWYLKYIDMNPYYGNYQMDYFEFLQGMILPKLRDENQKEKLISSILDDSN